jgi:lipoprotein-anchoring transpeptidase ErfK/SrfK
VRAPVWIALPILAVGCAGGSHHAAEQQRQQTTNAEPPKAAPRQRELPHRASAKPVHRAKPRPRPQRSKPARAQRTLPWRPDGTSRVVFVHTKHVAVYGSPHAKHAQLVLKKQDGNGTQRAFLVRGTRGNWVHVYLPTRPNGSLGWVRARAVRMYSNRYRIVVRLRAHKLQLWRKRHLVATYPVATGTSSTPTPRGLYYIVELLQPSNPGGSYGPYSFGLSAHSNVLQTFAGGDGRVGLHGTNEPGLIGSSVSHGCIRLRNAAVRRLAHILPLGTPVLVRT